MVLLKLKLNKYLNSEPYFKTIKTLHQQRISVVRVAKNLWTKCFCSKVFQLELLQLGTYLNKNYENKILITLIINLKVELFPSFQKLMTDEVQTRIYFINFFKLKKKLMLNDPLSKSFIQDLCFISFKYIFTYFRWKFNGWGAITMFQEIFFYAFIFFLQISECKQN